jgi:hypothetical protein
MPRTARRRTVDSTQTTTIGTTGRRSVSGGQTALIGFLYQMVGTIGLRAWAECPAPTGESSDLEALLEVIRVGDLLHERDDQDAIALVHLFGLDIPQARVFIQFKYSQNPQRYPLTPGNLAEICENFNRGTHQWSQEQREITRYCVITNRPLSPDLHLLMLQPGNQREHPQFTELETRKVLQKSILHSNYNFSTWYSALERFAHQYGTKQNEFERGIDRLIAKLVRRAETREDSPIQKEDLAQAFRDHMHPLPLTASSIRERTSARWDEIKDNLGVVGLPVRRRLLDKAQELLAQHALLVFTGDGGRGKSVAAWHLLNSLQKSTSKSSNNSSVATFLPAGDAQPHTLSWIVGDWDGTPERHRTETTMEALERLCLANPYVKPVLCLGLDGLDEHRETGGHDVSIREVVLWFWRREQDLRRRQQEIGLIEPPEAVLILTCRTLDTITTEWLRGDLSMNLRNHPPEYVKFTDYTSEELLEAIEQIMPQHIDRFEQALTRRSFLPNDEEIIGKGITSPSIYEETLEALLHPAMWFALRRLNPSEREYLLNGEQTALDRLAEEFIHWFCFKVWERRPNWIREDIVIALKEVAFEADLAHAAQFPFRIWINQDTPAIGSIGHQLTRLYDEAQSAGVIVESEPRRFWHWRHPFVGRYLTKVARKERGYDG